MITRLASPRRSVLLVLGLSIASACGGTTETKAPTCKLTGVTVSPGSTSALVSGTTVQLTAAVSSSGCTTNTVAWSTSSATTASVSGSGTSATVTGGKVGTATITATVTTESGSSTGSATVAVTAGALSVLSIAPPVGSVEVAKTVTFTATATDAGGNDVSAGQSFQWSASNTTAVTLSNSTTNSVVATGKVLTTSPVTIFVLVGGKSAQASLNVSAATASTVTIKSTPATLPRLAAGDTVPLSATATDAAGSPVAGTPTWSSDNASVAAVDPTTGVVTSTGTGTANIKATIGTASATIALNFAAVLASERLGYALADSQSITTEYTPDPNFSFNGTGGGIRVLRTGVGNYRIRFLHMGLPANTIETLLATAYGSGSAVCASANRARVTGAPRDLDARVTCYGVNNQPVDAKFTVLVVGQAALPGNFAFTGTEIRGGPTTASIFFNWNPTNALVSAAKTATGLVDVKFGLPIATSDPYLTFVSASAGAGSGTADVCRVTQRVNDVASLHCQTTANADVDQFSFSLMLKEGQTGKRFGMVWDDQPTQASYVPLTSGLATNSAGGLVSITRTATGKYTVTFAGLGATKPETVIATSFGASSVSYRHCNVNQISLANGGKDFRADVQCWDGSGNALDSQFYLMIIE